MIDAVIVTVKAEKQEICVDMELPAQLAVKELAARLLESLKEIDRNKFRNIEKLSLFYDGTQLPDDATLASEAIWDGSILIVR